MKIGLFFQFSRLFSAAYLPNSYMTLLMLPFLRREMKTVLPIFCYPAYEEGNFAALLTGNIDM